MRSSILILLTLIGLNGCKMGPSTYEIFASNRNSNIGWSSITLGSIKKREIYSEDKYIYKREHPKGCHFGYLTNRDDKPEKVIGWIIISGKEFCKEQRNYSF